VPLRLGLNLPSFRLEVYQGERLVRRYRVAVGDSSYPTPIGQFAIWWVEWDPWWTPPRSEWAKGDTVTPPGPTNPMGRVKLAFQQLYFIHGTPAGTSLGRAASHGCVRLANPDAVELARLVQHYGSAELSAAQVDSIARASGSGKTRRFALSRPVLLEIRYDVAEVHHDTLILYPDIYGREQDGPALEQHIRAALRRAGLDPATLDSARIASLDLPATGRRVFLLSALTRSPAPRGRPAGPPRGAPSVQPAAWAPPK
jgi:murein L,D-transpeptidase YcbB/YkuD